MDDIQDHYRHDAGNVVLDLTRVDFAGESVDIRAEVHAGNLTIVLPPDVDTTVDGNVDVGNAEVFSQSWQGIGNGRRTVTDLGADGADAASGGELHITASVNVGNLEVHR